MITSFDNWKVRHLDEISKLIWTPKYVAYILDYFSVDNMNSFQIDEMVKWCNENISSEWYMYTPICWLFKNIDDASNFYREWSECYSK